MDRDPKRRKGPPAAAERHTINVTRLCLRTGSVQLPFALAGRLPEGELLAHELESAEALVLWSEPPRRLAGLGPLFEANEVQVNDAVILEVDGDTVRLGLHKRPRRARPKVTPSTWASHRLPDEDARRQVADPERPPQAHDEVPRDERAPAGEAVPDAGSPGPTPLDATDPADLAGPPDDGVAGAGGHGADLPDDAPRAPRVKVKPLAEGGPRSPSGASNDTSPPRGREDHRAGLFGGMVRTVQGWFGSGDAPGRPAPTDAAPRRAPDWTQAWNDREPGDDPLGDPASDDLLPDAPSAAPFDRSQRAEDRQEARRAPMGDVPAETDAPGTDAYGPPPPAVRVREQAQPERVRARAADTRDPRRAEPARATPTDADADADTTTAPGRPATPPARPEAETPPEVTPPAGPDVSDDTPDEPADPSPSPDDVDVAAERAAQWQDDGSSVPSRAERFLAGDLRTRMLRFLSSPDMPLIAKTEMVASRFDLDPETAGDLLRDISDDPPDGLRLTPVREGAWRVERTGH
ncbi:MAG: hypothetical protein U5K81_03945 [Trueperaceae bacterium]|nr:hypothetical protein [Trueperaceae bacterium]